MAAKTIGPYQIEGVLGRGGMGTVYRGRHSETKDRHAVKVLSPHFADDPHFRGRFESEIKALLKLNHENIVTLLSYGQEDGQLFFAMELVEGKSLFQMQKAGHKFDWRQVLQIAKDCAHGLRHAHDRGVIHRDLKPGNLMMEQLPDGTVAKVKLTDFGIAKRFGNSQNTGTNILGTMDFMSPEQAKGEPVTERSDLYSLGTVLFTLLSGRPPFSGNSVEQSLRNLTNVPAPRISAINPAVPKPIDDLIGKLMEKNPENRVPTALALLHKISDAEEELRDDAEAKTAHSNNSPTIQIKPLTAQASQTIENSTQDINSSSPRTEGEQAATSKPKTDVQTGDASADLKLEPFEEQRQDYFNTVTDSQRRQEVSPPQTKESVTGLLPLVLAFAAVVGLGIFGWIRATAPPSAEQLFSTIQDQADQPDRVLEEIDRFLRVYPDEPRAESVAGLKKIGDAIYNYRSLVNTLRIRTRTPEGLTDAETKFLEIANQATDAPQRAGPKMQAFVVFYQSFDLQDRDLACLEAARGYEIKVQHESQTKALNQLQRIRNAIRDGKAMEDPNEALPLFESTRALYQDVDWSALPDPSDGTNAMREINAEIQRLENKIRMQLLEKEIELKRKRESNSDPSSGEQTETQPPEPQSTVDDISLGPTTLEHHHLQQRSLSANRIESPSTLANGQRCLASTNKSKSALADTTAQRQLSLVIMPS